jgi:hypothetical protein
LHIASIARNAKRSSTPSVIFNIFYRQHDLLAQWGLESDDLSHLLFDKDLFDLPSLWNENYYLIKHVDPVIRAHYGLDKNATLYLPEELRESIRRALMK